MCVVIASPSSPAAMKDSANQRLSLWPSSHWLAEGLAAGDGKDLRDNGLRFPPMSIFPRRFELQAGSSDLQPRDGSGTAWTGGERNVLKDHLAASDVIGIAVTPGFHGQIFNLDFVFLVALVGA